MNNEQGSDVYSSDNFSRLVKYARRGRPYASESDAVTPLAFILPLGNDVSRKFDFLEISRPHDAATMPQMRIRFRPSDAFLPSLRGATVLGK
jgi:hypothetical protein